jgi:hypothetical protein
MDSVRQARTRDAVDWTSPTWLRDEEAGPRSMSTAPHRRPLSSDLALQTRWRLSRLTAHSRQRHGKIPCVQLFNGFFLWVFTELQHRGSQNQTEICYETYTQ